MAVMALVLSLLSTALFTSSASAAMQTNDTFNAVVDFNNLKILRESDTPNSKLNADEPTILVWRYQVELGNENSGEAEYMGRRTFSGRDGRDRDGIQIHDLAGRFTLPSAPAGGASTFAMGTVTMVLDSDACSGATYNIIGNLMEDAFAGGLNAFAAENPDILALALNPDPVASLVDALAVDPNVAQGTTMILDCIYSWWVVPTFNFDDLIGVGATMVLGLPPIEFICDAVDDASGDQGTVTLIDYSGTALGINFSIFEEVEASFDATVDDKAFFWNFDDDDAHYQLRGNIEVNGPSEWGSCPEPPPPPPPPPPSNICQELFLAWDAGLMSELDYLNAALANNCPV